jgi:hypothetical protein
MRVYGNLVNRVSENTKSPTPEVGMGVTIYAYSDRYPGTVTKVWPSGKTIEVTEDDAKRIDKNGLSESQEYEFSRNENGRVYRCRLDKEGRWRVLRSHEGVSLGERDRYYDFSF